MTIPCGAADTIFLLVVGVVYVEFACDAEGIEKLGITKTYPKESWLAVLVPLESMDGKWRLLGISGITLVLADVVRRAGKMVVLRKLQSPVLLTK